MTVTVTTAFTDKSRASERSIFALYQVIEQGLDGTSMASFAHLPPHDRWALALYVRSLTYPAEEAAEGEGGGDLSDLHQRGRPRVHRRFRIFARGVISGNILIINLLDESNKPTSAKGFSGTVLIVSGGNRETVQLAVAGDSSLKGEAKNALPSGAAVTLVLKNAAGKSGQVKF